MSDLNLRHSEIGDTHLLVQVNGRSRAALGLGLGQMIANSPNFTLLDATLPDVARLVTAMVQARDAVERRSWSHPQEPTGEEWWAEVLADPRARKHERHTDLAVKRLRPGAGRTICRCT